MTKKGIDVSTYQKDIDWQAVKNSGIDFAILRVGYGDDIQSQDDDKFIQNANACTSLGIPFGVYIFSYADSYDHINSELTHTLRLINGYKLSYPVYLDLEDNNTSKSVGEDVIADFTRIFCEGIKNAGYCPGVYASKSWFNNYLTNDIFKSYERWIAHYYFSDERSNDSDSNDYSNTEYGIWQYSSCGYVDGIDARVDMNYCYKEYDCTTSDNNINNSNNNNDNVIMEHNTIIDNSNYVFNGVNVTYRVKTNEHGWLDEVVNYQNNDGSGYGGWTGCNITDIAVKVSEGSVKYRVHILGGEWLGYVTEYDINNGNGYAGNGNGSVIDAIEVYYNTPSNIANSVGYMKAQYRTSKTNNGYYSWQCDNETDNGQDGYSGSFGNAIDRLQIAIAGAGEVANNGDCVQQPQAIQQVQQPRNIDVVYQAYANNRWLGEVTNLDENESNDNGFSGIRGQSIKGFKAHSSEGTLYIKAHIVGSDWLPETTYNDFAGCTNLDGDIDAVQIRLDGLSGYDVQYRVSTINEGYLPFVIGTSDYAGSYGKTIDRLQIKIIHQ